MARERRRILYIEASCGFSGDRALDAMLALGLPKSVLKDLLARLGISYGRWGKSIPCKAIHLLRWVMEADWPDPTLRRFVAAPLQRLIQAESRAHRVSPIDVHFHQLAKADTLAAFIGFAAGLIHFKIGRVYVSPIRIGNVCMDHDGRLCHRPSPAVMELLKRFSTHIVSDGIEWTTPTGAAILAAFAAVDAPGPFLVLKIGDGLRINRRRCWPDPVRFLLGDPVLDR
jgi:uncharacterized protein (DUF111 family)